MRMLMGCVALLVALVIVSLIAKTPLKWLGTAAPAVEAGSARASAVPASEAGPAETAARELLHEVQDKLARAMQFAPDRGDDSR